MKVQAIPRPSSVPGPAARAQESAAVAPRDYVVLVYTANNVPSLGSHPQPVAGSYRLLPELKALAARTQDVPVSLVTQGYEKTESGRWETHRYRIEHGTVQDETANIQGFRNLYSQDQPPVLQGQVADSGADVSMFSQESVEDFLRDSLAAYPGAKNVVLFLNAHGAPTPKFGGEAIIGGEWQTTRHEEISVHNFAQAVANVSEQSGVRIALLDLNTCEMGKAENLLELGPHADFMLASPQNEFVPKGHETTAAFQDIVGACSGLLDNPRMSPAEFGRLVIDKTTAATTFSEDGKVENPIPTLALHDMTRLPDFQQKMGQVGERLSQLLDEPAGQATILGSLRKAFVFRDHVVDLKGFLAGIDDPVTRDLSQALDSMVVTSFAGTFRDRDYSQAGPLAVFMPTLPPDKLDPVLIPEVGEDLKPLLDRLTSNAEVSKVRSWVVGQSSRLNTLFSHLKVDYPAMLEVLPNAGLEKALSALPRPEDLLTVDQEFQAQMTTGTPQSLAPLRQRLRDLLAPLQTQLAECDVQGWIDEFQARGGAERLTRRALQKTADGLRRKALEPVQEYQSLQELPEGWKQFQEKLTRVVVDEEWAPKLVAATPLD